MKIECYNTPPGGLVWDLYGLYAETFRDVNRLAAQRHLMTLGEYMEVQFDPQVTKYVAYDDDGAPIGQGCSTDELAAWPLISPEYFEARWPDLYRTHRIWYVGYVGTHPGHHGEQVFDALITEMAQPMIAAGGLAVMDFCARNLWKPDVPRAANRILERLTARTHGCAVDRQEFWAFRFDGQEP